MNKIQIIRNIILAFAVTCLGLSVIYDSARLTSLGLLFWCISVVVKVSNAKDGVRF